MVQEEFYQQFFLNNLFENLYKTNGLFSHCLFSSFSWLVYIFYTLKCSCIWSRFSIRNSTRINDKLISEWKGILFCPTEILTGQWMHFLVNVFNKQICLVNALHIFTSSFSATKSNSYLVASINFQHLNHMVSNQCHNLRHFIMMDPIPLFSHVDRSSHVVSIWLQSMYVTLKKIKNTNILGLIKPEKSAIYKIYPVQCMTLTQFCSWSSWHRLSWSQPYKGSRYVCETQMPLSTKKHDKD